MEIARLGKKGQISIPKRVLKRVGLAGETLLTVDVTPEGAIILRPAGVYPIEIYSEARLREFAREDKPTPQEVRQLKRRTGRAS